MGQRSKVILASMPLAFAPVLIAGCSTDAVQSGAAAEPVESTARAAIVLPTVPEDAQDFQVVARLDKAGNLISRDVLLSGGSLVPDFDPKSLPKKAQPVPPPAPKVSPGLSARLRPSVPGATTDVVVSIAHNVPFSHLTPLLPDQARDSAANMERLSQRAAQIADVDRRRKPFRDAVIARARSHGARVIEEFTVGNAVLLNVPDAAVAALAADPDILEISANEDGTPPPAHISDGTGAATGMNSVALRSFGYGGWVNQFFVADLDTGCRGSHTVFTSSGGGVNGLHGDCVNGNDSCVNSPFNASYNDQDPFWNHGTPAANIIRGGNSSNASFGTPFIGVSTAELDYFNIYSNSGLVTSATIRGFHRALALGDKLLVGEIQAPQSDSGSISQAADDAFDAGAMVIAAQGNSGAVTSPAAPGNAHKALAVGDYDAVSGTTAFQVNGSIDNRIKPDIQTPSVVDAAGNGSDTAIRFGFNGTSAATAFAGGAAAIMYNWYSSGLSVTLPGNVYTGLLTQGDNASMGSSTSGVGHIKLAGASMWATGSISLGTTTQDVSISVGSGQQNLKVAIWWPERQSDAHDDVDLVVLNGSNTQVGSSNWSGSVWEYVSVPGSAPAGTYKIRFVPYSMPRTTQTVYYTLMTSF